MNKVKIRKKILKLRKKNFFKNITLNSHKLIKIIEKKNLGRKIIGGYFPHNYEIDSLNILKKLESKRYKISLPKIGENSSMNFYEWSFKDPLTVNVYGIPEPISKKIIYPDILFVPLLAFDDELNRLGYGGGYYDRYLSRIRKSKKIITIGIAYSFQKVQNIPTNKYDMKLDHVLTEKNFY